MTESKGRRGAGMLRYLREAFTFRWNILALLGAGAAAILSPAPDVLLPLVGAVELVYLTGLVSIPRFRSAIDAKAHHEAKGRSVRQGAAVAQRTMEDVLQALANAKRQRFEKLRQRCLSMRQIARGVRGRTRGSHGDDLRTPALDRLLWVFLRLLHSEQALETFLAATDEDDIKRRLLEARKRHQAANEKKNDRILRSLTDSIATHELRLANYTKAEDNAEFVAVELERIEGKIQALTEMSVGHEDPDYITSQVDSVAESMVQTETAMRELDHITGLAELGLEAPSILNAERVTEG